MPDDDVEFAIELAGEILPLQALLDEHVRDFGEVLTHVFFGDVSRWAVGSAQASQVSPTLNRLLSLLEDARRTGAPDTRDLIDQSFIENICGEPLLAARLPPLLSRRYQQVCGT